MEEQSMYLYVGVKLKIYFTYLPKFNRDTLYTELPVQ